MHSVSSGERKRRRLNCASHRITNNQDPITNFSDHEFWLLIIYLELVERLVFGYCVRSAGLQGRDVLFYLFRIGREVTKFIIRAMIWKDQP